MNRKLNRVLDEIQKTEEKIAQWQKHLKELHILREQLENEEIVKSIRSMKLGSRELLAVLQDIQCGAIAFSKEEDAGDAPDGNEGIELPESMEEEMGTDGRIPDIQTLEKESFEDERED